MMRLDPAGHPRHPHLGAVRRSRPVRRGFTLVELLTTLAIILVLISILLVTIQRVRASATSAKCLSNLRQIHSTFLIYAADHQTRLPDPLSSNMPWESALRKYIGNADVFRCPADSELFPVLNSSYDWRDTGDPATTMAGRRLDEGPSSAVLVFEGFPGWHAKGQMNYVRLDGVALTAPSSQCLNDLQTPIRSVEAVDKAAKMGAKTGGHP